MVISSVHWQGLLDLVLVDQLIDQHAGQQVEVLSELTKLVITSPWKGVSKALQGYHFEMPQPA